MKMEIQQGLVFGLNIGDLLGIYDPNTQSWKTSAPSLFEDSTQFLDRLPKSGIMLNGRIYEQATWARRIKGNESGLLHIPTPQAIDGNGSGRMPRLKKDCNRDPNTPGSWRADLKDYVKMWPTPCQPGNGGSNGKKKLKQMLYPTITANDAKNSITESQRGRGTLTDAMLDEKQNMPGGQLNPQWVDWLMGYPVGWTDLEDSEMQLSLK